MNRYYFGAALFLLALSPAYSQNLIIPQVIDGGGWQMTLVLTNTTASATFANLSFFSETGGGGTQSWDLQFQEGDSGQGFTVPAAGTLLLHTFGTAGSTTVGWGQVQASSGVNAYAILTQGVPGSPNQVTTAPGSTGGTGVLVPFDNTNGNVTSVALVNPTGSSEPVAVGIQLNSGASSQPSAITMPAQGHMGFSVAQQFPATSGQSGQLELYSAGGQVAALGLLFDSTGAFTGVPVSLETGSSIIVSGGAPGGGTLPAFNTISLSLTFAANNENSLIGSPPDIYGNGNGGYFPLGGFFVDFPSAIAPESSVTFNTITVSGQTLSFGDLLVGSSSVMYDQSQVPYPVTSASLSVTLIPNGIPSVGAVSGVFSFTSSLTTLTGTISGTYLAY